MSGVIRSERFAWDAGQFTITRPSAKGDTEGHPFHGNRYTGGIGGGEQELAHEVYSAESAARERLGPGAQFENIDKASEYAAKIYEEYAHPGAAYRADATFGSPIEVRFDGEPYQSGVARVSEGGSVRPYPVITLGEHMHDQLTVIHEVSHIIANEREQGLGPWKANHGGVFKDTFKRILQGEMAAHATLIKSVERVPGKKGEGSGHAFRGNRWTGGIGGDGRQTTTPTAKKPPAPTTKLRHEDLNDSQRAAVKYIEQNIHRGSRMGWKFGEPRNPDGSMPPAHPLDPQLRAGVIGAVAGLESAGLDHEELVRAMMLEGRISSPTGYTAETWSKDLVYLKTTMADERADTNPDHYSPLLRGDRAEEIAREVAGIKEEVRIAAGVKESQGGHMLTGEFPEFARPQLEAVRALIQRDGSLYPERVTLTPQQIEEGRANGRQVAPGDSRRDALWDEHLQAVIAVGKAIEDEKIARMGPKLGAMNQAQNQLILSSAERDIAWQKLEKMAYRPSDTTLGKDNPRYVEEHQKYLDYAAARATYEEAKAVSVADKALSQAAERDYARVRFDVLSQIRPMSERASLEISKSTNKTASESFLKAVGYYPADWTRTAMGKTKLEVGVSNTRAYCSGNLAKTGSSGSEENDSTALHELGHFMENYGGRSIRASEYAFYNQRTNDQKDATLRLAKVQPGYRYRRDEITRTDTFTHPYMGKTYGGTPTSNFELLTMGMEHLRNPSTYLGTDTEYRLWLLGTLATA